MKYLLIIMLIPAVVCSAQSGLSSVLAVGNIANNTLNLDDGYGNGLSLKPSGYLLYNSAGALYGIRYFGGTAQFLMPDGSSTYTSYISPNGLTADRHNALPNKDGTFAVDAGGRYFVAVTGVTFITITHGLSFIPVRIQITPALSNTITESYHVTVITPTTFTVSFYGASVIGTFDIYWQAY